MLLKCPTDLTFISDMAMAASNLSQIWRNLGTQQLKTVINLPYDSAISTQYIFWNLALGLHKKKKKNLHFTQLLIH